ncbi:MAG: hypothetical protein CL663_00160 [Bacteroidetes bacterium]|nr:hypothetical protein [Bacteroidota bacterium]
MSEFSEHNKERIATLIIVTQGLIEGGKGKDLIDAYDHILQKSTPKDVITAVDELVKLEIPMKDLKVGINKLLNQLFKAINSYKARSFNSDGLIAAFVANNSLMDEKLKAIRPLFKAFNKDPNDKNNREELLNAFKALLAFEKQYIIKENILFPILEDLWEDFRCVQVMWSIHDDIRKLLKQIIHSLETDRIEVKSFNRNVGDLFFNMYAIKFREEKILYPILLESVEESALDAKLNEAIELGFPYHQPKETLITTKITTDTDMINLGTGAISIDQIKLIFNHLPVDITYVDEHDKVCYFSTPKKRIFPRTISVIGRDVKNCHPKESVHVVEQIVAAFKNGERDHADFWIRMNGEFILIQYFAVRNDDGEYKGVIEVSQEITEISELEGERRLLNWD